MSIFLVALLAQLLVDESFYTVGAAVTLQGCVVAGRAEGTYVLTGLKEWPATKSPMGPYGPRHYWFRSETDLFASHLDQTVQVRGTIVEIKESEVEREPGGWHGGSRVAIELPEGRDVETAPYNAGVGMGDRTSRTDMKITLLRLEVENLLVVKKTCLGTR